MASATMTSRTATLMRASPSSGLPCTKCVPTMSVRKVTSKCGPTLSKRFEGVSRRRGASYRNTVVAMALPEKVGGNEEYVQILEAAYADESLVEELQERMRTDKTFSMQIKVAMQQDEYRERLQTAIEASPYMKKVIESSPQAKQMQEQIENSPLLQPLQDETVLSQLETLQDDPKKMMMMMKQSEVKVKKVAADLVLGVKEYYDDFQPDADELIEKFEEIAEKGYQSFMRIAVADKRVQNAIINALMDEMEEEQKNRAEE
uniref:Uncharacterized protein n=1 Tax=Pyramimonas obovata TaxID=1411642 RepID=A0A7S0RW90_9CHLO|mmetsp:Transcript_84/g.186  ORF Transcript_84/g.186 Transcript_84/m.186 type:complete len:261 (+) Transcript_84:50-832(+)